MKSIADLHTHTLASGHALHTIAEMVAHAASLGYKALAITDHGPAMPGAANSWYFQKLALMPEWQQGILLLPGAEVNVMDALGTLDLSAGVLSKLRWVIASMHTPLLSPMNREETTACWLRIAQNPYVDMIGHCEQGCYPFDHDKVCAAFAQNQKVVEMNAGSALSRPGNEENLRDIALKCKEYEVRVALTSDAHSIYEMEKLGAVMDMLTEIQFPEDRIINTSMAQLQGWLALRAETKAKA